MLNYHVLLDCLHPSLFRSSRSSYCSIDYDHITFLNQHTYWPPLRMTSRQNHLVAYVQVHLSKPLVLIALLIYYLIKKFLS